MTDYRVMINGIEVNARYSRRAEEEIFLPLLRRWTEMQKEKGKRLLVMLAAPPGAGKSTLLNMMAGLLAPTAGTIRLDDTDLYAMDDQERSRLRNRSFGIIPQGQTGLNIKGKH